MGTRTGLSGKETNRWTVYGWITCISGGTCIVTVYISTVSKTDTKATSLLRIFFSNRWKRSKSKLEIKDFVSKCSLDYTLNSYSFICDRQWDWLHTSVLARPCQTVSGDSMKNHFRSTTAQMYDAIRNSHWDSPIMMTWKSARLVHCGWQLTGPDRDPDTLGLNLHSILWQLSISHIDILKHTGDCSEPHALMVWNTQVTVLNHMHWWSETHRWLFWTTCTYALKHTGDCSEPHALML